METHTRFIFRSMRGAVATGWLLALLWPLGAWAQMDFPNPFGLNGFDVSNASVPVSAIEAGGPAKDGIPAIDHPKFVSAQEAALKDEDRVLGLVIGNEARAYPILILNWHEVVNDRFGDRRVVITYCPLCGTGMAFDAVGKTAEGGFGVSGLLYNSDVLLYDRATQSLWSQILQTAISGPLKGTQLRALPLVHTSWSDWRARRPNTKVLSRDTGFKRDYARDPYAGYERIQRLMFNVAHRDERYPLKEWVLGVVVNGKAKAYPFSALANAVDAQGMLTDTIAGRAVRVRFDAAHRAAEVFDAQGRQLPSTMAYWFAWVAFHPKTEVLSSQGQNK